MKTPHVLYYFPSRESLLREVIDRWDDDNVRAEPQGADFLQMFRDAIHHNLAHRGVVHAYLGFAAEAVAADHTSRQFFRLRFARVFTALEGAIRDGQRVGLVRLDLDVPSTARRIVALSDGLQLQGLIDPALDAPSDLDAALNELFVSGSMEAIPVVPPLERASSTRGPLRR